MLFYSEMKDSLPRVSAAVEDRLPARAAGSKRGKAKMVDDVPRDCGRKKRSRANAPTAGAVRHGGGCRGRFGGNAPGSGEDVRKGSPPGTGSLRLDGTGAGFLFRDPVLPVTASYPFWGSAWVQVGPRPVYANAYNIFSSERTVDFAANGTATCSTSGCACPGP